MLDMRRHPASMARATCSGLPNTDSYTQGLHGHPPTGGQLARLATTGGPLSQPHQLSASAGICGWRIRRPEIRRGWMRR